MFGVLVRRLSTSTPVLALIQPPVQVFGLEGRYASALYSAATKQKALDKIEKDIQLIKNTLKKDVKLHEFCLDPSLQRATKINGIGQALDKLKVNEATKNLFVILAENGRLSKINSVIDKFEQIMTAYRGEVNCTVRTAKPLDKTLENELRNALNGFLKPGEKLQLTLEIDPSIIGGMVVSIGDRFVDMSIARKVRSLRGIMEQPI
ncbi:ATP synthase delta chain, putative [Schistosoma mansoni]|uniref:Oligomycin sensitivity conferral protein n=1 Tax=Schistosoma mansoni TaxID=6183 RepID=G4LWT1_SCHMA|nr:ATP synthase delta chain, putative [Schistosoma mansoni]|eukprot:XP_018645721.1 ATP synthase delta chain, putative [Schistosoma mansoni]